MSNWRLIEAELVDACKQQEIGIVEVNSGDRFVGSINLTAMAVVLSDRLTPTARPVQVKAEAECKVSQPTECKV